MAIFYIEETKPLTQKIINAFHKVEKERERFGFGIPDDYNIHLWLSNTPDACASAEREDDVYKIHMNFLPMVQHRLSERYCEFAQSIIHYFEIAHTLLTDITDTAVISLIKHPKKTWKWFEENEEALMLMIKAEAKQNGTDYDLLRRMLMRNAKPIREKLDELLPYMYKALRNINLGVLRHELDHLDFFQSRIYEEAMPFFVSLTNLQRKMISEDIDVDEYVEQNVGLLQKRAEYFPLIEPRAFFFSFVPMNGWKDVDYNVIKQKILHKYFEYYTYEDYSIVALDQIVDTYLVKGEMNQNTANYILGTVRGLFENVDSLRYQAELMGVDFDMANYVINDELSKWRTLFYERGRIALDAMIPVFKKHPERFALAQSTKSFDEYIAVLRGE